jgi:hypothetical protein
MNLFSFIGGDISATIQTQLSAHPNRIKLDSAFEATNPPLFAIRLIWIAAFVRK